jgi:AcrR family transcriptional regulator
MAAAAIAYHHGDLRRALLRAAAELVEERGVGGLTLRAVAKRAGVSHAAPAHHFADKAALLGGLAAEGYQELARSVERALAGAGRDPAARLQAVARGYFRFATRRPDLFQVMFRPELVHPADPVFRVSADGADRLLAEVVAECVEAGLVQPERAEALRLASWALIHGLTAAWLNGDAPRRKAVRQSHEEALHLFVGAVLGAAAKGG